jgi:hypothetical protein
MRLTACQLISHDPCAIDVESRWRVVEAHRLLGRRRVDARNRKWELRLVEIARQALRVLVDADEQKRHLRIVLVLRVRRFEVR